MFAGLRASRYAPLDSYCRGSSAGRYGNQIVVRVDIVVVPGIGRNPFSVTTSAKEGIATIFDYENPRLEGFNVTVPLRNESGDLCSFVLDFSADGYGAKELAIYAVANAQVWHQWLGHLHTQSLNTLRKRDGTGITLEGRSRIATFAPWGRLNNLLTQRQPTKRSTDLSSSATGT